MLVVWHRDGRMLTNATCCTAVRVRMSDRWASAKGGGYDRIIGYLQLGAWVLHGRDRRRGRGSRRYVDAM